MGQCTQHGGGIAVVDPSAKNLSFPGTPAVPGKALDRLQRGGGPQHCLHTRSTDCNSEAHIRSSYDGRHLQAGAWRPDAAWPGWHWAWAPPDPPTHAPTAPRLHVSTHPRLTLCPPTPAPTQCPSPLGRFVKAAISPVNVQSAGLWGATAVATALFVVQVRGPKRRVRGGGTWGPNTCLVRAQEPFIARVLEQTSACEPGSARPDGRRCSNRRQHHGSRREYECIMGSSCSVQCSPGCLGSMLRSRTAMEGATSLQCSLVHSPAPSTHS